MRRWWLGAGGNLGDVGATLTRAVASLRDVAQDVHLSRLYETTPVGAHAGDRFVNAVIGLTTDLTPLELLDVCQAIENACGRTRTVHWGPRTLDLDLLLTADGVIVDHPRLTVPHPHFWYRRFVLEPLAELAPEVIEPRSSRSVREWLQFWCDRPLGFVFLETDPDAAALLETMERRFPGVLLRPVDDAQESVLTFSFAELTAPTFSPGRVILPREIALAERSLVDLLTAATDAPVVMPSVVCPCD